MADEAQRISTSDGWVSDGAYFDWTETLFQNSHLVIWLDPPWRVASYHILSRHIRATMARDNPISRLAQTMALLALEPEILPRSGRSRLEPVGNSVYKADCCFSPWAQHAKAQDVPYQARH